MIDTLPDARACVCPAPDDGQVDAHCAHDACPACGVLDLIAPCWALVIADIVDECEAETHDTGDMLVVHGVRKQRRLMIYSSANRYWVTFAPPPSPREPVSVLYDDHPETLDDARWIAASWLATLPREDAA